MQHLKLIQLCFYICQVYEEELKWHCQRFAKNGAAPKSTDFEILATYLFGVGFEQRFQIKQVHRYITDHWLSWFPDIQAYQTYNARLLRLASTFPNLVYRLVSELAPQRHYCGSISLTDSMPIMTCSNQRHAKVALELCNKGYNAVKKRHFYGVKLHAIGFLTPGALPLPEYLQLSPASELGLSAQRGILEPLHQRIVVGDKTFHDKKPDQVLRKNGSELLTPVIYQDDIQRAAKVTSYKGLLVHVFGKIAAAFMPLIINHII